MCKITMNNLTDGIEDWAVGEGLDKKAPTSGMMNLMAIIGRLANAMNREDFDAVTKAIGDAQVSLDVLSLQLGVDSLYCKSTSYKSITLDKRAEARSQRQKGGNQIVDQ